MHENGGRVVKGVNTTPDVQPGETERQAKKFFGGNGKPKPLGVKGATPNQAFNLGLVEAEVKKDILKCYLYLMSTKPKEQPDWSLCSYFAVVSVHTYWIVDPSGACGTHDLRGRNQIYST